MSSWCPVEWIPLLDSISNKAKEEYVKKGMKSKDANEEELREEAKNQYVTVREVLCFDEMMWVDKKTVNTKWVEDVLKEYPQLEEKEKKYYLEWEKQAQVCLLVF